MIYKAASTTNNSRKPTQLSKTHSSLKQYTFLSNKLQQQTTCSLLVANVKNVMLSYWNVKLS